VEDFDGTAVVDSNSEFLAIGNSAFRICATHALQPNQLQIDAVVVETTAECE